MKKISKENALFQIIEALKENRRKRNELGEIFVEGIAPIKAAAASGKCIKRIIIGDFYKLSDWAKKFIQSHPEAELISLEDNLYQRISDKDEPSEMVITVEKENVDLSQIKLSTNPFIVIFDRPSNHGNLGSVIRSANTFGVDLLVTTGHSVDIFDPATIRASLGGVFHTPVYHLESGSELETWLQKLKQEYPQLKVIGTDSQAKKTLGSVEIKPPVVLLLGNEAKGLSVKLQSLADEMISIPMKGQVNSLNVACAATIMMFEVLRNQRL